MSVPLILEMDLIFSRCTNENGVKNIGSIKEEPKWSLVRIRIVNSHATAAYECELLAFKWHYLRSVRREMLDR